MKKYLMTGIAALALCAGFTSCSHDDITPVSQGEIAKAKYDAAFIKAFGQPAANQTWGFGTTKTRAVLDMDGNEENYYNMPTLSEKEEDDVVAYVNMTRAQMKAAIPEHKYSEKAPDLKTYFFVTQVHTGDVSSTTYQNLDDQDVYGPSKMNHLVFRESSTATLDDLNGYSDAESLEGSGWYHINNFNGADNTDWGGNTLVISGGTYDFAYLGSEDSKYHNKWIIVDGADINEDLYSGYYYVCFDFEQQYASAYTSFQVNVSTLPSPFRNENKSGNVTISGKAYETADQIIQSGYTTWTCKAWNTETNQEEDCTVTITADNISNIQIVNGNMCVPANDVYTDWIVRLVKATPKEEEEIDYDGRIMAEDLSATEAGDFDFNDVVFDYKLNNDGTATVKLRAAGGTLELYVGGNAIEGGTMIVGGHEVHSEFGVGLRTMVNTGAGVGTIDPEPFDVECADNDPYNIKIWVKKGDTFEELEARRGNPASKFRTETTTKWCDEYISISNPYPNFGAWVQDASVDWTKPFFEQYADKNLSNNGDAKKGSL